MILELAIEADFLCPAAPTEVLDVPTLDAFAPLSALVFVVPTGGSSQLRPGSELGNVSAYLDLSKCPSGLSRYLFAG